MTRLLFAAGLWLTASSSAGAYCTQRTYSLDFADSVKNTVDYLMCLHNDQVDSLNRHANALNAQSAQIRSLQSEVQMLRAKIDALARASED